MLPRARKYSCMFTIAAVVCTDDTAAVTTLCVHAGKHSHDQRRHIGLALKWAHKTECLE